MRLIERETDPWRPVGEETLVDPSLRTQPWCVLSVAAWASMHAGWPVGVPVALALDNTDDPQALAGRLERVTMIALHFPRWTDGRAYSQAHLLRTRLRFGGELRATGDVLADMLPLLARSGVDAVVLRADQRADTARRVLERFPGGHYQGDAVEPRPRFARA